MLKFTKKELPDGVVELTATDGIKSRACRYLNLPNEPRGNTSEDFARKSLNEWGGWNNEAEQLRKIESALMLEAGTLSFSQQSKGAKRIHIKSKGGFFLVTNEGFEDFPYMCAWLTQRVLPQLGVSFKAPN